MKDAGFHDEASLPGSETAGDRRDRRWHELPGGCGTVWGRAPSAAVKWRRLWLETGSVAPRAQGGDTRSGRIEAAGPAILAIVAATPGITLVEIAERLEREHGERFAPSTIHRFCRRHDWSFKTYGPPRWQVGCLRLGSVVRKRIRRSGAVSVAMMAFRALWSS